MNHTLRLISGLLRSSSLFEIRYSHVVDLGRVVDRVLQVKYDLADVLRHPVVARVVEVHVEVQFHNWDKVVCDLVFIKNIEDLEHRLDGCKSDEDLEVIKEFNNFGVKDADAIVFR